MTTEYAEVGDTVYFGFGLNDSSGADDADSTPVFDVREAGATASDAPTLSGNCTLLSHANYEKGAYEVGVACTSANGFVADTTYLLYVSATVNTTVYSSMIGTIKTSPLTTARDLGQMKKTTVASVNSQISIVLTAGSGDNNAYTGCQVLFEDSDGDPSARHVTGYTAATKTLTFSEAPDFTIAATDKVTIFANRAERYIRDVETDTQDIQARLPVSLTGGSIDANLVKVAGGPDLEAGGDANPRYNEA